uniref:AlNc14C64G4573 protein n=1 Tax=Albugo laibachii Nc14 TaxID=890382 RepID=F0WD52_9STRA|nr:AlNc14C64G4573 [Albugo laibachii Nc14]|eukprot:CCA19124.1 AlNc14C64G4573 [Albugo laibachii Nc14]
MSSRNSSEAPVTPRVAISYEEKHRIFMYWQKHPTMAWFRMQQRAQEQLGVTLRRSTAQRIKNMDAEVFMSINPLRKKSRSVKFPLFGKALIEFNLAKQDLKINESELQLSNGWLNNALFFYVQGIIRSFKARYKKLLFRWCLDLVESNTLRKLTLLEAIEFSIESWRSVSEQVIRNCWGKTGLIDAIINAEYQSNNDYRLNSIPFQQECAQFAGLMAALGIRASIDNYIDAEDVEVVHDPPLANLDCSESDASDYSSDHEPVVTTAEAL